MVSSDPLSPSVRTGAAPLDQQGEPFAPFGTTLDRQGGFGRFLANVAELCYYYKENGTICGKPIKQ